MGRSITILSAIGLGVLLPFAGQFSFIIRYNLMVMLFLAFLNVRFSRRLLEWGHAKVLAVNLFFPLVLVLVITPFDPVLALALFAVAVAPTAAVAPAITGFLGGEVAFVTTAVLLTSPIVALVLPLTLPWVAGKEASVSVLEVAGPVLSLIFIPLGLSYALRRLSAAATAWMQRFSGISFLLFLSNVFIASASASAFVSQTGRDTHGKVMEIALAVVALCLFQFRLGEWLGRPEKTIETGMALGRKNTMFGIWLALTFIQPIAALGPIFYILFQNLYYSWQMYGVGKGRMAEAEK